MSLCESMNQPQSIEKLAELTVENVGGIDSIEIAFRRA